MEKKDYKILWIYLPFLVLLFLSITKSGFGLDVDCWVKWAKFSLENGFRNTYKSGTDYLPILHYLLNIFSRLQGNASNIAANIHYFKVITILFEFGSTLILFKLLNDKFKDVYKSILYSLFYLLNFAILYNSMIWNQVDGILTFFAFCSIIAAYYKKSIIAIVSFVFAINMKPQAIIFLPILILLLIPIIREQKYKKNILLFVTPLVFQTLILLPFILAGDVGRIWSNLTNYVDRFPCISMNAYNFWHLITFSNDSLSNMKDTIKFAGISYKNWGMILFMISSFISLFWIIKPTLLSFFKKMEINISLRKLLISTGLICLLFFYFNTQMHERYPHPAIIFIASYSLLYKRPLPFIFITIAYFLNLESALGYLKLYHFAPILFYPITISILFLITILLLFFDLFKGDKNNIEIPLK